MEIKVLNSDDIKKVQVNILEKFMNFCKKNNLKFSIIYGTLLGAVRHHGFIPWDDDIDVCMMREDYDKLNELLKYNKISSNLESLSFENNNTPYPFIKIYDNRTEVICSDSNVNMGVWIDVFPVDYIDGNTKKIYKKETFYRRIILSKLIRKPVNSKLVFIFKYLVKILTCFIPTRVFTKKIIQLGNNPKGDKAGIIIWGDSDKEIFPASYFEDLIYLDFENLKVPALKNFEIYLERMYGKDYMELPPLSKRTQHNFIAKLKEEN